MASSLNVNGEPGSGLLPDEPLTLLDVEGTLQQMGVIASGWESKYCAQTHKGLPQKLLLDISICMSEVDHQKSNDVDEEDLNPDGEQMPTEELLNEYHRIVVHFEAFNFLLQDSKAKK